MNDKIHEFYEDCAREYGTSEIATCPDHWMREVEIRTVLPHIVGFNVLDVGCGNGYSTLRYRQARPYRFVGLDYSEEMIKQAKQANLEQKQDVVFLQGDIRHWDQATAATNTVISTRCLINMTNWLEQRDAILAMKRLLKPGGCLILVENFIDGLRNLNQLRQKFDLPPIEQRWHNRYMSHAEFLPFIEQHFHIKHQENHGNLYYIISRVVYAALCADNGMEPDYKDRHNEIASQLPTLGEYALSPNWIYVLKSA